MTIREEVLALVHKAYQTGNYRGLGGIDCDTAEIAPEDEAYLAEFFMSLTPLRLAELAEQMNERLAGNYEVQIVDTSRVVSFETDALEGVMRGVSYAPVTGIVR